MAGFYGRTGVDFTNTLTPGLESLALQVRPAAIEAATAGAEIIRQRAYENANVSAGVAGHGVGGAHMRDEIRVEVREAEFTISARIAIDMRIIPYAAHQEFGPHGNAFMRRAIDETRDDVHAVIKSTFTASLGAKGKFKTAVRFRSIA